MRNTVFSILLIGCVIFVSALNTFAQDSPQQWHLPEGAKARLGRGEITGNIAYSPDGNRLAVAGSIGVWIYKAQTIRVLNLLSGHRAPVTSVSFSPDGQTIASGSLDGTIRLWDTGTGSLQHTLTVPEDNTTSVSFSPNGKMLAGVSLNGTVNLWDTDTGQHLLTPIENTGTFGGDVPVLENVSFSPDGKILASGAYDDKTIHLWDTDTGNPIGALTGHTDVVLTIAFSPDRNVIASGSKDNTIRLWDAGTGSLLRTLTEHNWSINSIAFSPDGKTLAGVSDGRFFLWDAGTGNLVHAPIRPNYNLYIKSVAFNPDGKTFVSVSRGKSQRISLWHTDTWQRPEIFTDHTGAINSVAFSPNGQTIASGGRDGRLYLWDTDTNLSLPALLELTPIRSVTFSPDGKTLASAGYWDSTGSIYLLDTDDWHLRSLTRDAGDVKSISFSPDSKTLASIGNGVIRLWNAGTGSLQHTLTTNTDWVWNVAFSPDGKMLASDGGLNPPVIHLWDATTHSLLRTLTAGGWQTNGIAFSPDGKMLAIGDVKNIFLWDTNTWQHLKTLTRHIWGGYGVAFSPDGRILASGNGDTTIDLWDTDAWQHLKMLTGHTERVITLEFSPDSTMLSSGSRDGTVLLWDLTAATPEQKTIAADVNGDGVVNIIDLTLVAAAFGNTAAAPEIWSLQNMLTRAEVEQWLRQARQVNLADPNFQHGIFILEQLLASLTPKETVLLPNYPNPFNPETWIPYQLATPADVSISIYAADGKLVRTLDLGHQPIGIYESRSRAAYWDGRNALGEPVASGLYFYTLAAGEFTATRKMLIRK